MTSVERKPGLKLNLRQRPPSLYLSLSPIVKILAKLLIRVTPVVIRVFHLLFVERYKNSRGPSFAPSSRIEVL